MKVCLRKFEHRIQFPLNQGLRVQCLAVTNDQLNFFKWANTGWRLIGFFDSPEIYFLNNDSVTCIFYSLNVINKGLHHLWVIRSTGFTMKKLDDSLSVHRSPIRPVGGEG